MPSKITQAELKKILHYDPDTGVFTWVVAAGCVNAGDIAGGRKQNGYRYIKINGTLYLEHRLVWMFVYGYFPENDIDHINRVRDDNRISNLREVSQQCNSRNTGNPCDNTSGVKGVYFSKTRNKWQASIAVNQRRFFLGRYKNFDDAVLARFAAEVRLNWAGCDSSRMRVVRQGRI